MTFICEQCGKVDTVLIDGYVFGDTLLEGVMFRVKSDGNKLSATIESEFAEYIKKLNKKQWMKECIRYIELADDFSGQCPVCGGEVYPEN